MSSMWLLSTFLGAVLSLVGTSNGLDSCEERNGTLDFLFMTSFGGAFNSSGSALGMMMALERINANSTVLPDYKLGYTSIVDSQCNRSISLSGFFDSINNPPCRDFLAVIGSGCSVATEPVAEIGHFWGLSHISYASSAGVFKNTERFRKYFQLYHSEDNIAPAVVELFVKFGWKQVGIITQRESIFTRSHDIIRQHLLDVNITLLPSRFLDTLVDPADLRDLFPEDARIFFLNMYEDKARQVICQAYLQNLYGPHHLWVMFGWYDKGWWREKDPVFSHDCTEEQLDLVVKGSLAIESYDVTRDTDKRVVGDLSYNEYRKEYSQRVANSSYSETLVSHLAYDATWTLAFALDKVEKQLRSKNYGNCAGQLVNEDSLEGWNFSRNSTASCLISEALEDTRFEGLSGEVVFDENGIRDGNPIRILQYRKGELILVAVSFNGSITYFGNESDSTLFPNGVPPDGIPVVSVTTLHPVLVGVIWSLTCLGILLAITCLLFVIVKRKKKILHSQLASNVLNYCLILGISMSLVSIFFHVYISEDQLVVTVSCYIHLWVGMIGYTIIVSAVLVKTWAIYYLFYKSSQGEKKVSTWQLIGTIGILVLIMVVILFIGSVIPQTRLSAFLSDDLEKPSDLDARGILQKFEYYRCYSGSSTVWLIILFLFLFILQIFSLVLVFQTRKIKLSDAKAVSAIIYVVTIVLVVLVIVTFAFPGYQNLSAALFSFVVLISTVSILVITFVLKMIQLRKNTDVKVVLERFATERGMNRGSDESESDEDKIDSLNRMIRELEFNIELKKGSIE